MTSISGYRYCIKKSGTADFTPSLYRGGFFIFNNPEYSKDDVIEMKPERINKRQKFSVGIFAGLTGRVAVLYE